MRCTRTLSPMQDAAKLRELLLPLKCPDLSLVSVLIAGSDAGFNLVFLGPEIVVSGPLSIIKLVYRFGIMTLKKLGAGRDYVIEKFVSACTQSAAPLL